MTYRREPIPTVHVVEPGGHGGVYRHAANVAATFARCGVPVVLHTAADAEDVPEKVLRVPCFWRFRGLPTRPLRGTAVALAWLAVGVPRCLVRAQAGDVIHIEGRFRIPALLVPLAAGARVRRCTLGFSPHTTYARHGRASEQRGVRWIARRADVVFAFSEYDRRRIEEWGSAKIVQVPLTQVTSEPDPDLVAAWRRRWGRGRAVVLLAGQLRPDKGVDVAVRAARLWNDDLLLAVVGEDHGAVAGARRLASELGVRIDLVEGYQPLPQLVAAIAAADVVVCPYRIASQSGVLAMAAALGRPTVAADVGGLAEIATVAVPPENPEALAIAARNLVGTASEPVGEPQLADAYLDAYALR